MSAEAKPRTVSSAAAPDFERHRLRTFVDALQRNGTLDIVERNIDLIDIAAQLDGNPNAVLFRSAGPEKAELVGNVMASRERLALAFGTTSRDLLREVAARLGKPLDPVVVASTDAPVHQVVLTGADADFTRLPVHLQHQDDGAPYISAGIDITQSLDGKRRNVGYRRIMLRGRHEAGVDLVAPSDLRVLYAEYIKRRERMPIAFALGSHPIDGVAATMMSPVDDELALMGGLRGEPVPLVRCATIEGYVPADAEIVLEGYLDERGWVEPEGPYGEYIGYYGKLKSNPVFHLTAITMRRDALFQTATIGGRFLASTDTAQLAALRTEIAAWTALQNGVRDPVAVCCTPSCGGMYNIRVALRQRYPGEARNAIASVFGSTADVKHVFVVDDDIDVFSDSQVDWALATRFQADRDLVVAAGFRAVPLDPSLEGRRSGAKAGFDLTLPFGWQDGHEFDVPAPPVLGATRGMSVLDALREKPQSFRDLMEATGSRDGREVLLALDAVRSEHGLERTPDGRYRIASK